MAGFVIVTVHSVERHWSKCWKKVRESSLLSGHRK